jgi:hypothetical protein
MRTLHLWGDLMTVHPFDLQARAELAAQSLPALLDPEHEGLMYFLADWRARPPRADHGLWDCGDGSGRHVDALTLARAMVPAGSSSAAATTGDAQLEAWMLRCLGEDGLSWLPAEPWAKPWGFELLMAGWQPDQPSAEISWAQRGTLIGLLSRFLASSDERYLETARRLIDGLLRIAVRHSDGLFYPEGYYQPGGWGHRQAGLFAGIEEYNAVVAVPLIRWYEATGYEPALELADGLIRFALKHTRGYHPDGTFSTAARGLVDAAHFHTRTSFIQAVLKLGLALGRREYVAWARAGYEHAKTWGTEFGWFPEHPGDRHGEICGTVDMIEIALLLGGQVGRAYYADAERFGRNQLLESQFLSLDRLQQALTRLPASEAAVPYEGHYSTTEGVVESQVGAFACRSTLNDAFHLDATGMMQCCNAAGARGLYDLWRQAVAEGVSEPGGPSRWGVHLRFGVETPALRVVSYEPAQGRMDVTARQGCEVEVRLPAGAAQALAVFDAEGARRIQELPASGAYVTFAAAAGEGVEVHYALPERVAHYTVGRDGRSASCTGHWRGETLMRVEPQGQFHPLYNRAPDLAPVQPALPICAPIPSL